MTLRDATAAGFVVLEERAPHEIVLGLTGRFWQISGGVIPSAPETFRDAPPAGSARAAWNFACALAPDGTTLLTTETRVQCADAAARKSSGRYWLAVWPGSGLLRRLMLRSVRRAAERDAHTDLRH